MTVFWDPKTCIIGSIFQGGSEHRPQEEQMYITLNSSAYCWIDTPCNSNINEVQKKISELISKQFKPYIDNAAIRGHRLIVKYGKMGKIDDNYRHPYAKDHRARHTKISTNQKPYIIGFIDPMNVKENIIKLNYEEKYTISNRINTL